MQICSILILKNSLTGADPSFPQKRVNIILVFWWKRSLNALTSPVQKTRLIHAISQWFYIFSIKEKGCNDLPINNDRSEKEGQKTTDKRLTTSWTKPVIYRFTTCMFQPEKRQYLSSPLSLPRSRIEKLISVNES